MPLVNFSNLNFDQIKISIRDYLKSNSNFTDYDFEGSNLSTIIDTLAYNTYIASYNANMLSNEVFIDSATLRENIVSLARNIGYVPTSRRSSTATVSFEVDVSGTNITTVELQPGPVAVVSDTFGSSNFLFSTNKKTKVSVDSDGIARFQNLQIHEGNYIRQVFTVDPRTPNQKYILTNAGIDTTLIRVVVKPSETSTVEEVFNQSDSLFDVNSQSKVYFIQEVANERYELLFGDGVFGKKLNQENLGYVVVDYITCNGEGANNIEDFSFAGKVIDQSGNVITSGISIITTDESSGGGTSIESIDSIRKYSTQIYASRNRAVTAADYEAIIPQIYEGVDSVSAFGGEDLDPPQFGKVYISMKPKTGTHISSTTKREVLNKLKKYSVAGIVPEIVDLKYLYLEADSSVYFNINEATSGADVKSSILSNIENYSKSSQLNKFGGRFRYSKYQKILDDSHTSVSSNITKIDMRRDLVASMNTFAEYEICYGNRFHVRNHGHFPVHGGVILGYNIRSSGFKIGGYSDTLYFGDIANSDLKTGQVIMFKLNSPSEPVIVKRNVGTIDYVKGEIKLNAVKFISTSIVKNSVNTIEISASPYSNDIIGLQDLYLQLDMKNVNVEMKEDRITSGSDISGSNYLVSPSFAIKSLVRGTEIYSTAQTAPQVQNTTSTTTTVSTTGMITSGSGTVTTPTPSVSPTPTPTPTPSPSPSPYGY